jgi:hypothetical protein
LEWGDLEQYWPSLIEFDSGWVAQWQWLKWQWLVWLWLWLSGSVAVAVAGVAVWQWQLISGCSKSLEWGDLEQFWPKCVKIGTVAVCG